MAQLPYLSLLALLTLGGCPAVEPTTPPLPNPEAVLAITPEKQAENAVKVLTPSPLDLEKEVADAGIAGGLADMVPKRAWATDVDDKDRVALRTGAVLSYTVLAGRTSAKPEFLAHLRSVRAGMHALGTGKGLLASIDGFIVAIENDTASREDFLQELDAVATTMVPEQGFGEGDRTGPLLQAGAWLAGTNLVAQAIVRSDRPEAADKLLRKAYVAEYFLTYVQTEGATKSGTTASALADALQKLLVIANQPTIGVAEARDVADATGILLGGL